MQEPFKVRCPACEKITEVRKYEPPVPTCLDKLVERCVRFCLGPRPVPNDKHLEKRLTIKCVHCKTYLSFKT